MDGSAVGGVEGDALGTLLFVLDGDVVVGGGVIMSSTGRCVVGFEVGRGLIVDGCITGFIVVGCIIGDCDPSGLIVVGLPSFVVDGDGHDDPHQPSLLHPSLLPLLLLSLLDLLSFLDLLPDDDDEDDLLVV